MKLKMIIGGLAAAVVVLTGGYDRLRDYVELWTGDRFLPETTNGQVFGSSPSSGTEDMEPGLPGTKQPSDSPYGLYGFL